MENIDKTDCTRAEEIMKRPVCPMTWLTNNEHCVHCDPDCAWFDGEIGVCGILTAARALRYMSEDSQIIRSIITQRAGREGIAPSV